MRRFLIPVLGVALTLSTLLTLNITTSGASTRPALSPLPSNTRIQQILADLGYLPLSFSTKVSGSAQSAKGHFAWRFGVPAAMASQWRAGQMNSIEQGALMTFERVNNLTISTTLTPPTERKLLQAGAKDTKDPDSYNYVYVSTTEPETVYLYVNGHLHYNTLANTGVSSSPTALGTWPVYVRYTSTTMSGTYPWGGTYYDTGIPWVSYFHGGDALHGFIRASYGFPQSLGCVEMPFANAKVLWPYTPIGTPVTVAVARP
jgi:lipoprotein-anchoring transpeptidase ErfK/SrfK